MRWLDRLLARASPYTVSEISALEAVDQAVELEGRIEALAVLQDPRNGEPAVALDYRAGVPGVAQRYFGIHEGPGGITARQAVDFMLRDATGTALIEVEHGGDVGELHRRLQAEWGIDVEVDVQRISPGDRIRVRGRVRALASGSSPHRREASTVIVHADELEPL